MNNTTSTTSGPPSPTFEYPIFEKHTWYAILMLVSTLVLTVAILFVIRLICIRTTRRVGFEKDAWTTDQPSVTLTLGVNNLPEVPPKNATLEPVVPFNANRNEIFLSYI